MASISSSVADNKMKTAPENVNDAEESLEPLETKTEALSLHPKLNPRKQKRAAPKARKSSTQPVQPPNIAEYLYDENEDDLEPLDDRTEALPLHSKRTTRKEKKAQRKAKRAPLKQTTLMDLPYELIMDILTLLRPSDVFNLARTNKALHSFIKRESSTIARNIRTWRYACLEKCFRTPVFLDQVDPAIHPLLQSEERQEILTIHKKPYQHVQAPDPTVICTCLTCLLRWSSLCLVVDFAHWQDNLDKGEPIPMIPRGQRPEWNQALISANAAIVMKALEDPLWHARLLEAHLKSTTRSIRRHAENKGNKRRRFRMSKEDVDAETDLFLERSGPPTLDFPFHRDNYYMLEAYMPGRSWIAEQERWVYMPAEQHETDVTIVVKWAEWRRKQAASATGKQ